MAESFSTDCGFYVASLGAVYQLGTTNGDIVPRNGNAASDLQRGLGMLFTGTAAAPAPHRALHNQLLPRGLYLVQTVPGTALASFTTRASLSGTFVNSATVGGAQVAGTISAGALNLLGRTIAIKAWGTLGVTGTPNYTVDVALGTNILATTGVRAMAAATSPLGWYLDVAATVTTAGASGVVVSGGTFTAGENSAVVSFPLTNSTPGTGLSIDLTAAYAFTLNATSSASDPANTLKCYGTIVEIIF
jgi:hypothetical protein